MIKRVQHAILFTLLVTGWYSQAQSSRIQSRIEKGQYAKAEQDLRKALKKDNTNIQAWYLLSKLYFIQDFPDFNIDSANQFNLHAKTANVLASKSKRSLVDTAVLIFHQIKIDSSAFARARQINTEQSYIEFLSKFSTAKQKIAALTLRDGIAFQQALKINTAASLENYLSKYPQSSHTAEAIARHEKLVFEEKTKNGNIKSFRDFLFSNPASAYRKEAERNIFEIATAKGDLQSFINFIDNNTDNCYQHQAINILYHLSTQHRVKPEFYSDSLRNAASLEKGYWIPVLKEHHYGFINDEGKEMISPKFTSVFDDYLCGDVRSDCLAVSDGIIGRNGVWIFTGEYEEIEDMGFGFLQIISKEGIRVVHKSGFEITSIPVNDARIVAENFIGIKENAKWKLVSFTGRELLPLIYDRITVLEDLIILEKSGKKIIATAEGIASTAESRSFSESFVFDDVRLLERGIYLVKNGSLEGAINSKLQYIVPLDRQLLTKAPHGFISQKNKKFELIDVSESLTGKELDQVRFYGNWISLKSPYNRQLFDFKTKRVMDEDLDSIWFSNRMAFATKNDSLKAYLLSGKTLSLPINNALTFIQSPDSINFFYTSSKKKKAVFDVTSGSRLFETDAETIEYIGYELFVVTKKEGKGLVDIKGKEVLPASYTAIVRSDKNFLSLLKGKKFGLYDLQKRLLIKPDFDRNITTYNDQLLIAFKDGFYGLINWQSQPQSKFEFEEIRNWSDSTVLVKKDFYWSTYSLKNSQLIQKNIKSYKVVSDSEKEKLLIIFQDHYYGVLSNNRGIIIPATFSSIVNLGSPDKTLYFADKHVEEAGIFIVIYYDQFGKLLRRQVYEDEEYLKISCADN